MFPWKLSAFQIFAYVISFYSISDRKSSLFQLWLFYIKYYFSYFYNVFLEGGSFMQFGNEVGASTQQLYDSVPRTEEVFTLSFKDLELQEKIG